MGATTGPTTSTTITVNDAPYPDKAQWKLNGNGTESLSGNDFGLNASPTAVTGQDGISSHALSFNGSTQYGLASTAVYSTVPFTIST